jgi:multisubunit Na+/H+ antiporter MnhF subunit
MIGAFLVAAAVLTAAMLPLVVVMVRGSLVSAVIALELTGVLTTVAVVCYAVGTQSTSAGGIAVLCAVLSWVSGMIYVRLNRRPR